MSNAPAKPSNWSGIYTLSRLHFVVLSEIMFLLVIECKASVYILEYQKSKIYFNIWVGYFSCHADFSWEPENNTMYRFFSSHMQFKTNDPCVSKYILVSEHSRKT